MNLVRDIEPECIAQTYEDRGLDRLTDLELFQQAAEAIQTPKSKADSFSLHAPLEILARFLLLRHVQPPSRTLARKQIAAVPAIYQTLGEDAPPPAHDLTIASDREAVECLHGAIVEGKASEAEAAALWLARNSTPQLVALQLADVFLGSFGAAIHSPIFLNFLHRADSWAGRAALPLLRSFSRELALENERKMITDLAAVESGEELEPSLSSRVYEELVEGLLEVPQIGRAPDGIYGLVHQAEERGLPMRYLSNAWRHSFAEPATWNEGFASICQVAATAMIEEGPDHAKFGWTHCLTIPQALWALGPFFSDKSNAVRVASIIVVGFRSSIGATRLQVSPDLPPSRLSFTESLHRSPQESASVVLHSAEEDRPAIVAEMATQAAIRNDAHLVKYTLACCDAAVSDPGSWRLYLAGAAYLLTLWMAEQPAETLEANLHVGRS
ncbi:MAG TPA: hypothetical protein VLB76_01535 [Thermoanaerobaculia bacterium]|jgi:hypothetical protein|nr:hypothetical protein [Thermoanaerobaculia bacterium]